MPRGAPPAAKTSPSRTRAAVKRATHDALLEAGLAEFVEHGLDAPSLDAICARAGYTRGAFYVHFRDRDDFLVSVGERVLERFVFGVIAAGEQQNDLDQTMTRFLRTLAPATAEPARRRGGGGPLVGMQVHRLLEACARSPEIRARLVGLIQLALGRLAQVIGSGQTERNVRRDVDAQQAATLLVCAAIGVLTAVELGLPLDFAPLRRAVAAMLAAPPRPRSTR